MRHVRTLMPYAVVLGAFLALCSLIWNRSPKLSAAQAVAEYDDLLTETLDILQSIRNYEDARRARPSLVQMKRKSDAVWKNLSNCTDWQAAMTDILRFWPVVVETDRECQRTWADIDIAEILYNVYPFTIYEMTAKKHTLLQFRQINFGLDLYHTLYGRYPETLADLTMNAKGFVAPLQSDEITDPWGKPFLYDLDGPHHRGKCPDVWTNGAPCGENKGVVIGNWMKEAPTNPPRKTIFDRP